LKEHELEGLQGDLAYRDNQIAKAEESMGRENELEAEIFALQEQVDALKASHAL
jgi:hypothetical protein